MSQLIALRAFESAQHNENDNDGTGGGFCADGYSDSSSGSRPRGDHDSPRCSVDVNNMNGNNGSEIVSPRPILAGAGRRRSTNVRRVSMAIDPPSIVSFAAGSFDDAANAHVRSMRDSSSGAGGLDNASRGAELNSRSSMSTVLKHRLSLWSQQSAAAATNTTNEHGDDVGGNKSDSAGNNSDGLVDSQNLDLSTSTIRPNRNAQNEDGVPLWFMYASEDLSLVENVQRRLWYITTSSEYFPEKEMTPLLQKSARIFQVCSLLFVVVSVVALCVESLPDLYQHDNLTLDIVEFICIVFFTTEVVVKLWASPNARKFWRDMLNIIDIVSILPFYIGLMIPGSASSGAGVLLILRIIRLTRIFRVFKLSRYNQDVKLVFTTIMRSRNAISLLVFLLIIALTIFSSLIFFVEQSGAHFNEDKQRWELDDDGHVSHFQSIPASMWWCIVTLTTVGFGDAVPTTGLGRLVASFAMLVGVLVIAFPTMILGKNFNDVTNQAHEQQREMYKKLQRWREMSARLNMKKKGSGSPRHHHDISDNNNNKDDDKNKENNNNTNNKENNTNNTISSNIAKKLKSISNTIRSQPTPVMAPAVRRLSSSKYALSKPSQSPTNKAQAQAEANKNTQQNLWRYNANVDHFCVFYFEGRQRVVSMTMGPYHPFFSYDPILSIASAVGDNKSNKTLSLQLVLSSEDAQAAAIAAIKELVPSLTMSAVHVRTPTLIHVESSNLETLLPFARLRQRSFVNPGNGSVVLVVEVDSEDQLKVAKGVARFLSFNVRLHYSSPVSLSSIVPVTPKDLVGTVLYVAASCASSSSRSNVNRDSVVLISKRRLEQLTHASVPQLRPIVRLLTQPEQTFVEGTQEIRAVDPKAKGSSNDDSSKNEPNKNQQSQQQQQQQPSSPSFRIAMPQQQQQPDGLQSEDSGGSYMSASSFLSRNNHHHLSSSISLNNNSNIISVSRSVVNADGDDGDGDDNDGDDGEDEDDEDADPWLWCSPTLARTRTLANQDNLARTLFNAILQQCVEVRLQPSRLHAMLMDPLTRSKVLCTSEEELDASQWNTMMTREDDPDDNDALRRAEIVDDKNENDCVEFVSLDVQDVFPAASTSMNNYNTKNTSDHLKNDKTNFNEVLCLLHADLWERDLGHLYYASSL
eukprot:PhM_4_TR1692/c2_g1_i2/m.19013/K04875/KCNA2; potassium voltage-gated channel Shaker-related subfamily A member 2